MACNAGMTFFNWGSMVSNMSAYIFRRLLLMIPTLLGIIALNFLIVQAAPGGPVEQIIAQINRAGMDTTSGALGRISGAGGSDLAAKLDTSTASQQSAYRGARGIDPELIKDLEMQYGFDKPPLTRFLLMVGNYLSFDFGESFYRNRSVLGLIGDALPVTISLGLWSTLLIYLISIPLGIHKAVRDGSRFDIATSWAITIGYAIPGFLFALLLIMLFAGGSYLQWFPLRGLTSLEWESFSWPQKILDYFWHIALPTLAMVVGGFASLTMLTKNSFLDEIHKQYVLTAYAKGLTERQVLYRHVFRNAMLIVIAGFPKAFISIFFTSALLIEIIFSLNGLGLLGFEAILYRDYPVIFGTLFIFTLIGLLMKLIGDLTYVLIDPRIDFEGRG